MRSERGQATVEWVGLVLLVALVLGFLLTRAREVDDRGAGDLIAQRIACAGECRAGQDDSPAGGDPPPRQEAGVAPPPPIPVHTRAREAFRAGTKKVVALNGLVCFVRKSTARNDTNRVGDDVGDAVNCLNPVSGWTGEVGGTDD